MASRYRPRKQFKFLLYQDVDMELILTDFILRLKGERKFATVIKNGLRLIGSLQEHDLSVLYELFPWIEDAIRAKLPAPPTPDDDEIKRQIAELRKLILQQGTIGTPASDYPLMKSIAPLPIAPLAEIKQAEMLSADAIADNFLSFLQ